MTAAVDPIAPESGRRLRNQRIALGHRVTLVGLVILALVAIVGPFVVPFSPVATSSAVLEPPSSTHWFGTDAVGSDVFSRVVVATRIDLFIALVSVLVSFVIAAPVGAYVGFKESRVSSLVMRLLDFVQSFPVFIFAMALVAVAGPSVTNLILALTFLNVPILVRLVRSEVLGLRERTFVEAARSVGNSDVRIAMKHLLPNSMGTAIAQASTQMGWALLMTAGLTFVGAGIQPPEPEWGGMISQGAKFMVTGEWWPAFFPGLALSLAILLLGMAGDTFRDLYDVTRRRHDR